MALFLENLDERTRSLMLEELEYDIQHNQLHLSPYLSGQGVHDYPNLLRRALESGSDETLADDLSKLRRTERATERRKPAGGFNTVSVPANAAQSIAENEFNRYYIRAVARRAMQDRIPALVIYRAKPVGQPRPESEALVETTIDPAALLEDLRSHPGERPALGVPAGPGSGLSVRLP
jgi:hypothetical protein